MTKCSSNIKDSLLSHKERECLIWVALGKTTLEISTILGLSEHTVNFHLRNVCIKLNAPNRSAAITQAFNAKILTPTFQQNV